MESSANPQGELSPTIEQTTEPRQTGFWGFIHTAGAKILAGMDYVGETVVGVLGLDDSKFQYVMDGMDTEDWEKAVAIDRERRLEDAIMDAAEGLQAQDSQLKREGDDVEGGGESEEKKIKDYMNMVRDQVTADFWEKEIQENPRVEREIRQVVPDRIAPITRAEEVEVEVVMQAEGGGSSSTAPTPTTASTGPASAMSIEKAESVAY